MKKENQLLERTQKSTPQHADKLFRKLFHDPKRAIELCNAVVGTDYAEDTKLKLCSLDPNSILSRYNDLAFAIADQLILMIEHQSSINPNMPLRFLPYISDTLYTQFLTDEDLYGTKKVKIPTPKFFVLYNGEAKLQKDVLRLSNSFVSKNQEFSLELTAKIIDVNHGSDCIVLKKSPHLDGYALLVSRIRNNMKQGMSRDQAIIKAMDSSIEEKGILAEFLDKNYREVVKMLSYEYDRDTEMKVLKREAREEGREEGKEAGIIQVAKNLLQLGLPIEQITQATGLSKEEILRIQNEQ